MTDPSAKPDYGDTLEAQIVADMVASGQTLVDACRTFNIPPTTIYRRIASNPKFAEMMNEARDAGYDVIANNVRSIAAGDPKQPGSLDVKRARLMVETDLKLLAKWHPSRYGEKIQIEQKSASVAFPVSDDPVEAQRQYEALMKGG